MTVALDTRIADALAYEDMCHRTPGSFAIPLPGRGERGRHERPFWSKGWRGCEFNCAKAVDDWKLPMKYKRTVKNGVITEGWYCR